MAKISLDSNALTTALTRRVICHIKVVEGIPIRSQILFQSTDIGIGDITLIQKLAKETQTGKNEDAQVEFSQKSPLVVWQVSGVPIENIDNDTTSLCASERADELGHHEWRTLWTNNVDEFTTKR